MVIAAEQYASRLVVPAGQRSAPIRWSSHKDHAARRCAARTCPRRCASAGAAVKRADAEYARAERQTHDAR